MNRIAFVWGLLLSLSLSAQPAKQTTDPVSALLSSARDQARGLTADISAFGFFAGSDAGWQSHSAIVSIYKNHVEALRNKIAALSEARGGAPPWEQAAIDCVSPLLNELAQTADHVIAAFDKTPKVLDAEKRKDFLRLNSDLAGELSRLVGSFLDYAKTRQELASFEGGSLTLSPSGPSSLR